MSNLFRGKASDGGVRLDKELATLEAQASNASPGYETQFLNRAGNLCVEAGQAARARLIEAFSWTVHDAGSSSVSMLQP